MSKIRKSAYMQDCTVRLPGICNWNPTTTVLAHLSGGGMGAKKPDHQAAYCCSSCHDVIDGRVKSLFSKEYLELAHRQGVERTQMILFEKGLLVVA